MRAFFFTIVIFGALIVTFPQNAVGLYIAGALCLAFGGLR